MSVGRNVCLTGWDTPVRKRQAIRKGYLSKKIQAKNPPTEADKVYSPADAFVGIELWTPIQVRGVIKNKQITNTGEITLTLHDRDKFILVSANKDNPNYINGRQMTITGKYMTTKALELVFGTKISDQNIPVIWVEE